MISSKHVDPDAFLATMVRALVLSTQANILSALAQFRGDERLLVDALAKHREAEAVLQPGDRFTSAVLGDYASASQAYSERTGQVDELHQVVEAWRRACGPTGASVHPEQATRFGGLANALCSLSTQ